MTFFKRIKYILLRIHFLEEKIAMLILIVFVKLTAIVLYVACNFKTIESYSVTIKNQICKEV